MKKSIIALILATVFLIINVIPVLAAPPVIEEWEFASAGGGQVRCTYHINTTNLKTEKFTCYNNSDFAVMLRIKHNNEVIWFQIVPAHTTQEWDYTVNFRRLPATDPDDPDSIRYPQGYQFGMAWPWE